MRVPERCEVEPGLGEEAADGAGLVLHPLIGISERCRIGDVPGGALTIWPVVTGPVRGHHRSSSILRK